LMIQRWCAMAPFRHDTYAPIGHLYCSATKGGTMRIYVVFATIGRPELIRQTVDLIADQTLAPDGIVVASVSQKDVEGVEQARGNPLVVFSEKGLCRQRNRALRELEGKADVIVFFDDDFVPAPDYLENVRDILLADPEIVGMTGELVGDGINHAGYTFEAAVAEVAGKAKALTPLTKARHALYGCNMVIRMSAAEGLAFDEMLPLYGWQEDIDYTYQLGRRGKLISTTRTTGVHMGVKGGRTSGKKLGYSQIANVVYMWRKGTMEPGLGEMLIRRNVIANLLKSFKPEPHVDRRGRLLGNVIALTDWVRGRIDPRRIETL
jgi:glycosyltransferase involved in cell wall biosynthesis